MIAVLLVLLLATAPAAAGTGAERFAGALRGLVPQQKNVGLLLGVHNEDGYQTILFEYDGKTVNTAANVPLLAVPGKDGFSYLYERIHTSAEITENDIEEGRVLYREQWEEIVVERDRAKAEREAEQALPDDSVNTPPCSDCRNWDWEDHLDIQYVIPGHATLAMYGGGYTGGAHPSHYSNVFTAHLSSLAPRTVNSTNRDTAADQLVESKLAELYPVSRDPNVATRMNRELFIRGRLEYFIDGQSNDSLYEEYDSTEYAGMALETIDGLYTVDTTSISFVLERIRGRLHLKARADAPATYAESGDYALTAEYDCGVLDSTIHPPGHLPLPYGAFVKADDTVRDVLVAPSQNIVYVLADDTIVGVDVATKKVVFEYMLPEASTVVMAEWSSAAELNAWKAALK